MSNTHHLTTSELEAGLDQIRRSPKDNGRLRLIVSRPGTEQRRVLTEGNLDLAEGLVGDNWRSRGGSRIANRPSYLDRQLTIMNARLIALVAQEKDRWPLAGDQLYLDLDLSADNLPPGTRLALGTAVIEVTAVPHTGCKKFGKHYGLEAMNFVNSPVGLALRLRGVNTRVVQPGTIKIGDVARKV